MHLVSETAGGDGAGGSLAMQPLGVVCGTCCSEAELPQCNLFPGLSLATVTGESDKTVDPGAPGVARLGEVAGNWVREP